MRDSNEDVEEARAHFQVARAPVDVAILRASPREFHPLVRDGYRDRTSITYRIHGPTEYAGVTIWNAAGRAVFFRLRLAAFARGRGTWGWDGRNSRGNIVKPGVYRVRIHVAGDDGSFDADSIRVRVRR